MDSAAVTRAELDRILASGDPDLIAATCRTLFVALLEVEAELEESRAAIPMSAEIKGDG